MSIFKKSYSGKLTLENRKRDMKMMTPVALFFRGEKKAVFLGINQELKSRTTVKKKKTEGHEEKEIVFARGRARVKFQLYNQLATHSPVLNCSVTVCVTPLTLPQRTKTDSSRRYPP